MARTDAIASWNCFSADSTSASGPPTCSSTFSYIQREGKAIWTSTPMSDWLTINGALGMPRGFESALDASVLMVAMISNSFSLRMSQHSTTSQDDAQISQYI